MPHTNPATAIQRSTHISKITIHDTLCTYHLSPFLPKRGQTWKKKASFFGDKTMHMYVYIYMYIDVLSPSLSKRRAKNDDLQQRDDL